MKSTSHRHPERKPEAVTRQEAWASLSTAEQIKALDTRLGKGLGAARQRLRLSGVKKAPAPPVQAATAPESVAVGDETPSTPKKLKAKERRAKAAETVS